MSPIWNMCVYVWVHLLCVCVCVQTHRCISFEVIGVEGLLTFYQVSEAAQSTDSSLCYSSGSHQLVGFWSKSLSRVKGGGLSFASLRWGTYKNGLEIYLREICLFSLIYLFIHIYTINIYILYIGIDMSSNLTILTMTWHA